MKRVFVFVLACVLFLGSTYAQWNLLVTVKKQNGESLANAKVLIKGSFWESITDENGTCKFVKLPKGTYVLNVVHLGYKEYAQRISLTDNQNVEVLMEETSIVTEEVVIKGVRADVNQPATFSLVQKEDLDKQNLGQDVPYLLAMEPSVVTTSDGGSGIGYTSMRIRGLDATKINVTINGIPYNDAESHGVYWVDIPDIASSVRSVQIQRGLGKSSNGPGAFGASINLETSQVALKPYAILDNSLGSYNTLKNSIQAGTGLINGHWFAEGRFSRIGSNGYIDRASSKLRSYFAQAGYYSSKSLFRIIAFGGFEETYQAWYGIDSASINTLGRTYNWAGYYYKNGKDNFYNDEVDHYTQNHIQANYVHSFSKDLDFNIIVNYSKGRGYYQEYYGDAPLFANYKLNDVIQGTDTIIGSDMAGRKWLDNNLLAANTFLSWKSNNLSVTYGVALSSYFNAKHYGEIIWSEVPNKDVDGRTFYNSKGNKLDASTYLKVNYQFLKKGNAYLDLNYRYVKYSLSGVDADLGDAVNLDLHEAYNFVNPIIGLSYHLPFVGLTYATFGISHREPTREDYISNYFVADGAKPERLFNTEIGLRNNISAFFYELNFYNMHYKDELIKTGEIDNTGNPILKNVGTSNRTGIELGAGASIGSFLILKGNATFSRNRTDFADSINHEWVTYKNIEISYSPSIIVGSELIVKPIKYAEIAFSNKYVGKQYLDNTHNESRKLNDYMVSNVRINIKKDFGFLKNVELKLLVNNIFNVKYNSNGYMYGDTPYYFPQALRNFLIGISIGI